MARYYLNVAFYNCDAAKDEEGAPFETPDAAMKEAQRSMRELVVHSVMDTEARIPREINIFDQDGIWIGVVSSRSVVPQSILSDPP